MEVTVYNINISGAPEILHECRMLAEYETFVELVYEDEKEQKKGYKKPLSRQERDLVRKKAVQKAIAECLKRGILVEFLTIHAKEIIYMMTGPITSEDMKDYWMEEAREEGLAEGMAKGKAEGKAEGMAKGKAEGKAEGIAEILALIEKGVAPDEIRRSYI